MWILRVFNKILMKAVVSSIDYSCFIATGCSSESAKLVLRSVEPLIPEKIGLPTSVFL